MEGRLGGSTPPSHAASGSRRDDSKGLALGERPDRPVDRATYAASRASESEPLARAARRAVREMLTRQEAKGLIKPAGRVALDVVLTEGVDQHFARRQAPAQRRGDQRMTHAPATSR
jgi:hypothetical protein